MDSNRASPQSDEINPILQWDLGGEEEPRCKRSSTDDGQPRHARLLTDDTDPRMSQSGTDTDSLGRVEPKVGNALPMRHVARADKDEPH